MSKTTAAGSYASAVHRRMRTIERDCQIIALRERGCSQRDIADAVGATPGCVWRVLSKVADPCPRPKGRAYLRTGVGVPVPASEAKQRRD